MDRARSEDTSGFTGLAQHIFHAHMLVHVGDAEALPAALHLAGAEGFDESSFGTDAHACARARAPPSRACRGSDRAI